ncbi:FecR family protein [Anseongella ginsenosidimutans]|uniref:FecR family protein n=1 Tax=Anseongella ginsenosidimutans TaxID=496056 RepID=A0A4R3KU92_9SPHI|nr:FecR domain-containing protein [Anseongella ginsenosidimutans]QEC51619.1 DUF4974 domain-containing protein [Anseongella ginsenosidimutans]TCS88949.1 FecR family protein [Anseongella ginsenosidimutans]
MEAGKFYDQYTIEDFILDERFHDWVTHGRDDEFWQAQLRNCPEKSDMIHAARDFILNLKIREHLPGSYREQAAVQRFRELTRQDGKGIPGEMTRMEDGRAATAPARAGLKWLRGVAASLLVLCLLGGGTWMLFKKKPVLVKTEYGQMKQVKLPDNSIIYLNANSNLRYEKSLLGGFSREVWLEGEAFFEVEKQENGSGGYRNFLVHTQGLAVEVLGTSFNVRDRHAVSSVTLQSGKVEVNMDEGRKVMLEPGERVEISRKAKSVIKNKVKPERYTSWKNLRYTFDQTPVSELVQIINDNYGLQVLITDKKIAGSKLSGVLEANNLQTFVNALSFVLNITIRKEGNQLIFEPKQE